MEDMQEFIANDLFAAHLGIEVFDCSPGKARARMKIGSHHLNSAGIVHGGAIFALADVAFSVASNSHGLLAVAINVSISFFKAMRTGTIYASAEEISLNPKLATYLITVKDEKNEPIALFQGTVYRKKERISDLPNRV